MPLVNADVKTYKSLNALSDGGAIDTSRLITSGVDNNLFPDLTASEVQAGVTRYRKMFKKNEHATDPWRTVKSWIQAQPSNGTLSLGVGINHADDADGAQGNMTAFSAAAKVGLISDGADTRTATILGEDSSGTYLTENVVLTGATEVLSAGTFGKVNAVYLSALDASRTVTVRQGAGGTARGTIGPNKKICWLWRTGTDLDTEAEGFRHGDIAAAGVLGLWLRLVTPANATTGTGFSADVRSAGTT